MPEYPAGQLVHGSPIDEDDYLLSSAAAFEVFRDGTLQLTFYGHTHVQGGFIFRKGYVESVRPKYKSMTEEETWELPLLVDARYLINPGSVGQPRDGDWRAAFAMFDTTAKSVKFYRVPYPVELAQHRILAADLPEYLAVRLNGKIVMADFVGVLAAVFATRHWRSASRLFRVVFVFNSALVALLLLEVISAIV